MRKLIMWNVLSLDGFFDSEKNWELPWHAIVWGDELEQFSLEQLKTSDILLFGRMTYEGMASYWMQAEGAIADYMNNLPKLVCSRSLKSATWNNTRLLNANVVEEIAHIKTQGTGNIFVFGSSILSQTLMRAGLFDEYRIGIAPMINGRGRLLFGNDLEQEKLRLLETKQLSTGCVILRYQTIKL